MRDEAISHQCHASRSRLIGIGSVHECIYVRLAYSTSAGSHSVFVRVRVRYDSSHKTHSCTMVAACAAPHAPERLRFRAPAPPETMRSRAAQCGGGFREKVFGPPSPERSKRGGVCAYAGKNFFPRIASPIAPCRFGPSHESNTGALSIATSQKDATAECSTSDVTEAMLTAGMLGAERMRS